MFLIIIIVVFGVEHASAQLAVNTDGNNIAGHTKKLDAKGNLQAWYQPDVPGAGYTHVAKLASEFIKDGTPVDPASGLPMLVLRLNLSYLKNTFC